MRGQPFQKTKDVNIDFVTVVLKNQSGKVKVFKMVPAVVAVLQA
jgi:hypothetical protein